VNKKATYGIAGAAGVAIVIAVVAMTMIPAMQNSTRISSMKAEVENSIQTAAYYTIPDASTPAVVSDPATGAIYAVYFKGAHEGADVFLQKSTDGGQTFADPVRINEVEGSVGLHDQWSAPSLAVGTNGEVYVTWYNIDYSEPDRYPYGEVTQRFARSTDGGQTFEPSIDPMANDPRGERSYPYMTVSKDNEIFISYLNLDYSKEDNASGTDTVVRVISSTDGGRTFGESKVADKAACQCCATVAVMGPDNEVYAASRSVFLQTAQNLTNDTRTDYMNDSVNQAVIRDITVYHSTDGGQGATFTEPSRVGNDEWYMNGCPDSGPGMAFDSQGRLHVAWFTGSESASQGPGFYYTYSDDKGATFSTPVPLHLLSEKWIPPTTQYLVVDKNDNVWVTFVNSEGLKKSPTYEEDYSYVGEGAIHLAVLDRDGNVLRNGDLVRGDILKHYPFTTAAGDVITMSWVEGDDVKLAVMEAA
jgi:hypothetical protein